MRSLSLRQAEEMIAALMIRLDWVERAAHELLAVPPDQPIPAELRKALREALHGTFKP